MEVDKVLTRRLRQQAAVAELGQHALSGMGFGELIDTIVEPVAQAVEVEYCKILELLAGDDALLLRAGVGWREGLVDNATVGSSMDSQAGYTLASKDPVIVTDLCQETRFTGSQLLRDHGIVSGMSVIIRGVGRPFGVLSVHTSKRRTFAEDDVRFLQAVANIFSGVIERESARAKTRLQTLALTAVDDGIAIVDRQGNIQWANPAYTRLTGYELDEVLGKNPRILKSGKQDQAFYKHLWDTILAGKTWRGELWNKRKDGRLYLEKESITAVSDQDGEIGHFIAIKHDITENKRTEEDLVRFKSTLDKTLDCIFMFEPESLKLFYVNQGAIEQVGYSRDTLMQMTPFDIKPDFDEARFRKLIAPIITGPSYSQTFETVHQHLDGHCIPVEIFQQYVHPEGEPPRFVAFVRDISERQQLQRQLQQAQKMEAIGQLAGGIAHDFNNILASIMGYTELALDRFGGKGSLKLTEYLQEIYTAGERARDLISQMLIFSRVEGTKPSNISIIPIVKEAVKMLELIISSSIEFQSVIGNKIAKVCIDPVQLQQIVFNLCINARDAISGSGAIEVQLKEETHVTGNCDACSKSFDGKFIELRVTDTGEGIAPEVMGKIFDPFFTTKDVGKGTGMGLSIIQGIVHSVEGHILVERLPESGTVFRLMLPPAELADNPNPENSNKSLDKKTGNKNSEQDAVLANAHILVVDDEVSVAGYMRDFFMNRGYTVTIENDGQAALATFKANPDQYDIVITDQTMPKMAGLEISKEFLKIRPNLPIVLCTGYSADVDAEIARNAGIVAFLMKPINPSELQRIVEELLRKPS